MVLRATVVAALREAATEVETEATVAKSTRSIQLNPAKSFARESQRREVLTARSHRLCRSALNVCDFP
jgi:hypothetical protein